MSVTQLIMLGVSKNTEKPIKPRKLEKKKTEKPNREKNRLKFWKNRPVWFYKPETEKTEPNPNRKKMSQTEQK